MRNGAPARVINVSSRAHHLSPVVFDDIHFEQRPYDKWLAYGQSKSANVLFTAELERRLGPEGVHAWAVHPGVIHTELSRHMAEADWELLRERARSRGEALAIKSVEAGAATAVYAATASALNNRGGLYLEDCGVADINDAPDASSGVRSYALDPEQAARLWALSEALCGEGLRV